MTAKLLPMIGATPFGLLAGVAAISALEPAVAQSGRYKATAI